MGQYIAASAAGFLAGVAGSMGLGGGSLLLLYLTLLAGTEQLQAQGINLIFFIPCALVSLLVHNRAGRIDWKLTLPTAAWGIIGAVGGFLLSGFIGGRLIGKGFGLFLLVLGARELFRRASD